MRPSCRSCIWTSLKEDHNLLQAICRTNRVYAEKTHGLIVDYLGVFDEVGTALDFDDQSIKKLSQIWKRLKKVLPEYVAKCLAFSPE